MRRPQAITHAKIARIIRGAEAAGLKLDCIRIEPDGAILLVPTNPSSEVTHATALDLELAEFEARHGDSQA